MTSYDDYLMISSAPNSGCQLVSQNLPKMLVKPSYKINALNFLLCFWKQWES